MNSPVILFLLLLLSFSVLHIFCCHFFYSLHEQEDYFGLKPGSSPFVVLTRVVDVVFRLLPSTLISSEMNKNIKNIKHLQKPLVF